MLPTFMHSRRMHHRSDEQTGKLVRLVECPREMIGLLGRTGTIEGMAGNEVLVRVEYQLILVPAEYLESV